MVQRVATVAFEGIEARAVDVQVQVAPGVPAFKQVKCQCQLIQRLDCPRSATLPPSFCYFWKPKLLPLPAGAVDMFGRKPNPLQAVEAAKKAAQARRASWRGYG